MYSYSKNQDSPHDPTKLAIHCVLRPKVNHVSVFDFNFEKTVSFDDLMHFSDEENIVAYVNFDCGFSVYPEYPEKMNISTENGKIIQIRQKTQAHHYFTVLFTTQSNSVTLYL